MSNGEKNSVWLRFGLCLCPQFPSNGSNQIHIPALSVDGLSTPVVLSPGPQKPWAPPALGWARNSHTSRWIGGKLHLGLQTRNCAVFGRRLVTAKTERWTVLRGLRVKPDAWRLETPEPPGNRTRSGHADTRMPQEATRSRKFFKKLFSSSAEGFRGTFETLVPKANWKHKMSYWTIDECWWSISCLSVKLEDIFLRPEGLTAPPLLVSSTEGIYLEAFSRQRFCRFSVCFVLICRIISVSCSLQTVLKRQRDARIWSLPHETF